MTEQQKVREAFEAWAYEQTLDLTRFLKGEPYNNQFTQEAWEAWQAALAHASSATAEECSVVGDRVDCRVAGPWKGLCDQCAAGNYDACRYTHPAPSAEDARDQWSGVPNVVRQMRDCATDIANTKSLTGKWVHDTLSWYADEIDQALAAERGEK